MKLASIFISCISVAFASAGGFQYATAGAGLSLPQSGHAILLGQDGRINQAFTATGQQMQYLLTFALARGVQNCTSNARLVVSIAHGCVYLSQFC
ncbi:UNVERIFIED_CONTAM: hypothetical protein Sradi_4263000 [Sesamum radiatum]|uniref:DUF642 domain-containing protein n=2 Tax=Sesamum TaxID=4181 RepID=A0AAW2P779_SESRA